MQIPNSSSNAAQVQPRSVTFVGFDSAWTDNPRAPGAIYAVTQEREGFTRFEPPRLVTFAQGLDFIRSLHNENGLTLIAIDQPTIVPNETGMRPVERVAGSLVSWLGGGVQPANRGKVGMFDPAAPIWSFLAQVGGEEDPERSRYATNGLFYFEVFPALALASMHSSFYGRGAGPRYNPGRRKTFKQEDWIKVAAAVAAEAGRLGCDALREWCSSLPMQVRPRKAHQDCLDSAICLLVALRWRLESQEHSIMIGDLVQGYIVSPIVPAPRAQIVAAAIKCSVAVDGLMQTNMAAGSPSGLDKKVGITKT